MGRMLSVISVLFALSILFSGVKADLWNYTCIDGVETALFCDGLCSNPGSVLLNHTKICLNGCNNQTYTCDEPNNVPTDFFALAILAFLGMATLFIVIARTFKDDWGVVPILFFIFAMIFIVMAVGVLGSFFMGGQLALQNVINTTYFGVGVILFLFIAYIILRIVLNFAINMMEGIARKKRKRAGR